MYTVTDIDCGLHEAFIIMRNEDTGTQINCVYYPWYGDEKDLDFIEIGEKYDCKLELDRYIVSKREIEQKNLKEVFYCQVIDDSVIVGNTEMIKVKAGEDIYYIEKYDSEGDMIGKDCFWVYCEYAKIIELDSLLDDNSISFYRCILEKTTPARTGQYLRFRSKDDDYWEEYDEDSEFIECFADSDTFGFMKEGNSYYCKLQLFGKPVPKKTDKSIVCSINTANTAIGNTRMVEVSLEEYKNYRFYIMPDCLEEHIEKWREVLPDEYGNKDFSFNFEVTGIELVWADNMIHPRLLKEPMFSKEIMEAINSTEIVFDNENIYEMKVKDIFGCDVISSDSDLYPLQKWYNQVIDKKVNEVTMLDVIRMIKQEMFVKLAVEKSVQYLREKSFFKNYINYKGLLEMFSKVDVSYLKEYKNSLKGILRKTLAESRLRDGLDVTYQKKFEDCISKFLERISIPDSKVEELKEKLRDLGIPERLYNLDGKGRTDERFCLEFSKGEWCVYFSERGVKTTYESFGSEDEACDFIYEQLSEE